METSQNQGNKNNKVCQNCGAIVPDTCKYCPKCGTEVRRVPPIQTRGQICGGCGAVIEEGGRFCPVCGKEIKNIETKPSKPMKWYKFVIWVQLFLSAVLNLGTGIRYLTGTIYGKSASTVYFLYSGLKPLDILMGLLSIAAAVLAILVRQSLAHYKESGPGMYYIYWIFGIAYNVIYLFGLGVVGLFGVIGSQMGTQFGTAIVTSCVMLALNIMYFTKRMDMFVN